MKNLAEVAARMRKAVASQAYAEAEGLVPLYCSLLEGEFRSHPVSSPQARRIAEDARELYQWLARTVLLDRAQCAAELQRLGSMASYCRPAGRTAHTYELEG